MEPLKASSVDFGSLEKAVQRARKEEVTRPIDWDEAKSGCIPTSPNTTQNEGLHHNTFDLNGTAIGEGSRDIPREVPTSHEARQWDRDQDSSHDGSYFDGGTHDTEALKQSNRREIEP